MKTPLIFCSKLNLPKLYKLSSIVLLTNRPALLSTVNHHPDLVPWYLSTSQHHFCQPQKIKPVQRKINCWNRENIEFLQAEEMLCTILLEQKLLKHQYTLWEATYFLRFPLFFWRTKHVGQKWKRGFPMMARMYSFSHNKAKSLRMSSKKVNQSKIFLNTQL